MARLGEVGMGADRHGLAGLAGTGEARVVRRGSDGIGGAGVAMLGWRGGVGWGVERQGRTWIGRAGQAGPGTAGVV
jgi:hypothetical protein